MAVDYTTGGVDYEIDVPGAPIQGVTDDANNPIFYYRILVRRKKQGAGDPWKTIMDVGGKRPYLNSSSARALEVAKEWLDKFGNTVP